MDIDRGRCMLQTVLVSVITDMFCLNLDKLQSICREYYSRIAKLEDSKYDLEFEVRQKDFIINELNIQVNDLRGKLYVFRLNLGIVLISRNEKNFPKCK